MEMRSACTAGPAGHDGTHSQYDPAYCRLRLWCRSLFKISDQCHHRYHHEQPQARPPCNGQAIVFELHRHTKSIGSATFIVCTVAYGWCPRCMNKSREDCALGLHLRNRRAALALLLWTRVVNNLIQYRIWKANQSPLPGGECVAVDTRFIC